MNKKFEYIDDNPGSYFGMLVESIEDKKKLNEDMGDNKLTYDSQLDFIDWYKESTGRDDAFYFDDVDCVDEYNSANIPSVYCTGRLTWNEARDRLIKYFDRQDRSLVDSDEAKQFLKDFEYFCKKCKCIDLSNTKQPKMIQNDEYTKVYGAYFKYPNSKTVQLFTGKDLDEPWYRKYTATFDSKVLVEQNLKDLIIKINKLLLKLNGNKLQISNINSNEQLYKLALYLNMINTDEEDYGFQSLYSRPTMAYSNSFKYGDIFKKDGRLARMLNSITDGHVNAAFTYKDDPNIILVAMPSFNFLTTKDMIDGLNESLTEDSDSNNDYLSKLKKEESELQSKITSIQRQYHYKGYMKDYKYKMASNRLKEVKQLIFKLEAESKNEKVLSKADVTKAIKKISGLETLKTTTSGVRGYRPVAGGSFKVDDGGLNNFIVYFYNNTDKIPEIIDELKKQGFKISYVQKSSFNVENTRSLNSLKNEALTEDKFVPQDKMSKKAQKELNNKKRGTWGNTKPITRVQPNKKAYDRKRDSKVVDERLDSQSDFELTYVLDELEELSNYYRSRQDDWSKRDSEEFLKDMNDIIHITQHLFRKARVLGESKKLNESSDGWDESKLYDLSEILDEIYNLQYEVKNTVRGAYTNAHTYEELGYYVHNLGSNLMDIGDEIMEMEEEDDEDED